MISVGDFIVGYTMVYPDFRWMQVTPNWLARGIACCIWFTTDCFGLYNQFQVSFKPFSLQCDHCEPRWTKLSRCVFFSTDDPPVHKMAIQKACISRAHNLCCKLELPKGLFLYMFPCLPPQDPQACCFNLPCWGTKIHKKMCFAHPKPPVWSHIFHCWTPHKTDKSFGESSASR